MRNVKGSNSYLKNQVRINLAKSALSLTIFFVAVTIFLLSFISTFQIGIIEQACFAFSIVSLVAFYYYLHKYRIYAGGWQGEKKVAKLLKSKLSDEYILIDDLCLKGGGGDIDQIVLGPSGIFVLETKNWRGPIFCNGDNWQRGKRKFGGSPSLQVKRNSAKIKRLIDYSSIRRSIRIESVVVFANKNSTLDLKNPTVTVLKLPQLPDYIIRHSNVKLYSFQELEEVANVIVKQKH